MTTFGLGFCVVRVFGCCYFFPPNSSRMPQNTLISILKFTLPGIPLFQSKPSPWLLFGRRERFREEPLSSSSGRPEPVPWALPPPGVQARLPRELAFPRGRGGRESARQSRRVPWDSLSHPSLASLARGTRGSGSGTLRPRHGSASLGSGPWDRQHKHKLPPRVFPRSGRTFFQTFLSPALLSGLWSLSPG